MFIYAENTWLEVAVMLLTRTSSKAHMNTKLLFIIQFFLKPLIGIIKKHEIIIYVAINQSLINFLCNFVRQFEPTIRKPWRPVNRRAPLGNPFPGICLGSINAHNIWLLPRITIKIRKHHGIAQSILKFNTRNLENKKRPDRHWRPDEGPREGRRETEAKGLGTFGQRPLSSPERSPTRSGSMDTQSRSYSPPLPVWAL